MCTTYAHGCTTLPYFNAATVKLVGIVDQTPSSSPFWISASAVCLPLG